MDADDYGIIEPQSMIGRTVSHYRDLVQLGSGGMGVVYRARDESLGRLVAIKFISEHLLTDPGAIDRFRREARAASALNHPNICTIYEIGESDGQPFIAMEYMEGESLATRLLSGPLPVNTVIDVSIQLADALAAAHSAGIIHRDLKPANLFLTGRSAVKILDFGLAKIISQKDAEATRHRSDLLHTSPGSVVGTIAYMSPEQARGETLDARSDLFSLGAVIYEMATGRQAFGGSSPATSFDSILNQTPPAASRTRPDLPPELDAILDRSLEKDRELRYQSAADLRADLSRLRRDSDSHPHPSAAHPTGPAYRWVAAAAVVVVIALIATIGAYFSRRESATGDSRLRTIAVMPFSSLGADRSRAYLGLALPNEVITVLTSNHSLAVRPFASATRFAGGDPQDVGKALNVGSVVTGNYRDDSSGVNVTLEAVDVATDRVVWRDNLTFPQNDLISGRDELSSRIRRGLYAALGLPGETTPSADQPKNREAYALYLQSVAAPTDREPNAKALAMVERALTLDPTFASAWVELARREYLASRYGGGGEAAMQMADVATSRALSLDPDLLSAAVRRIISETERTQYAAAYRHSMELLNRRPRSADAHFALSYLLRYVGQIEESTRECERAYALDRSTMIRSCAASFIGVGDYRRAHDFVAIDRGSEWARDFEARVLLHEGRNNDALGVIRSLPSTDALRTDASLRCMSESDISRNEWLTIEREVLTLQDPEQIYFSVDPVAFCGNDDLAIRLLRETMRRRYAIYPAIDHDQDLQRLTHDPRYAALRTDAIRAQQQLAAEISPHPDAPR